MSIKPHLLPAKLRDVIVWDLEWTPHDMPAKAAEKGLEPGRLRLCGVYDGQRYRFYTAIADFLDSELTRENNGKWFYAHAGGMADLTYLFEFLLTQRPNTYTIEACMIGSSAAIVSIKRGRYTWHFLDSFRLIPIKLRSIGKWFGMEKGGLDQNTDIFYVPLGELAEYNEQDCRILYRAIMYFQTVLTGLGGQLEKTVASSALKLFRMKYLKQEIETSDAVNRAARSAYIASRVEVFKKHIDGGEYYDINSAFPFAMTYPQPGNYLCTVYDLPDSGIYLADVTVKVPKMSVPPLPYRRPKDGRIYHPTGEWRTWLTSADVQLLQDGGGEITDVREVLLFEPFFALKDYASHVYELRKNATDEGEKQVLKILLNSLYGKFAESELKSRIIINPPPEFFSDVQESQHGPGRKMLMPGVWQHTENKHVPHAHVPISAHITAIARGILTRYLWQAPEVYYCDTDGFCVPQGFSYPESKELGGLKHEKSIREGWFVRPKLYAWTDSKGDRTVKAKGFGRLRGHWEGGAMVSSPEEDARPMAFEDFEKLVNGSDVAVNQFLRVKTLIRSGDLKPREIVFRKGLRDKTIQKRDFSSDGASVPWDVGELA